jgi:hypothetical protein
LTLLCSNPIHPYVAVVDNVKEVTLYGAAELGYWREYLEQQNLFPFDDRGKAALFISGTELRWMGVRTRELAFSLSVCTTQYASKPDGSYLIHAFNSSRLFAFMERTLFQTPYDAGEIQVEEHVPSSFRLLDREKIALNASMSGKALLSRGVDELWEGAIFLPRNMTVKGPGNLFYARLGGLTEAYHFSTSTDTFVLKPDQNVALRRLVESSYVGKEWRIRNNATHARSKTYMRSSLP